MNRLGGKSNTGEGGEDPERFLPMANGDSQRSAIKQVASGRFGVTSEYLVNADELQIKMAQGAKPGEGGQLPGHKVYPWIAKVRHSTPGVGLISPPPHHDIYSIEDLAQLIFDLKNSNPQARISVKLVAEVGVGTVAAGVAKAHSDVVLISGHDGGTGASPLTSLKHAGLPWELGLAETQQVLVLNKLRDRIVVQADGQMKTGRDVVIGGAARRRGVRLRDRAARRDGLHHDARLPPEHLSGRHRDAGSRSCARSSPASRSSSTTSSASSPRRCASSWRSSASGRSTRWSAAPTASTSSGRSTHWKAKGLDLTPLLHQPALPATVARRQDDGAGSRPRRRARQRSDPGGDAGARAAARRSTLTAFIRNANRTVGTMLGYEVTRRYGGDGLPDDTIQHQLHRLGRPELRRVRAARHDADARRRRQRLLRQGAVGRAADRASAAGCPTFKSEENIIIGNVGFYGATSGEGYVRGVAGERFCVRNSGATVVVEGVGDHGCEYMTGGRVVVLGRTGRNFAAGMSGGVAYVLDTDGRLRAPLQPRAWSTWSRSSRPRTSTSSRWRS